MKPIKSYLLLPFCLLFQFTLAQDSLIIDTLNLDNSNCEDTYIIAYYPNKNNGNSYANYVGNGSWLDHTLIKFDLPPLQEGTHLQEAQMKLRSNTSNIAGLRACLVTSDWSESSATYNNRPSTNCTVSVTVSSSDYSNGWLTIDISALVDSMYRSGINYGIRLDYPSSHSRMYFYSVESSSSSYHPSVILTFKDPYASIKHDNGWYTNVSGSSYYLDGHVGINTDQVEEANLNIKGDGTTSATKSLALRKSNGEPVLLSRDDGKVLIGMENTSGHTHGSLHVQDRMAVLSNGSYSDVALIAPNTNRWGIFRMWNSRCQLMSNMELSIGHNSNQQTLNIKPDGKVAIGTINPGDHKLAVNGTIKTHEVEVSTTGWSDYVFDPDYELATLDEVKNHIDKYGHLPNIPSEQEVLKNGIQVGDMHKKLLAKIEELTLYLIEQKGINARQDDKIKALEELINK